MVKTIDANAVTKYSAAILGGFTKRGEKQRADERGGTLNWRKWGVGCGPMRR